LLEAEASVEQYLCGYLGRYKYLGYAWYGCWTITSGKYESHSSNVASRSLAGSTFDKEAGP